MPQNLLEPLAAGLPLVALGLALLYRRLRVALLALHLGLTHGAWPGAVEPALFPALALLALTSPERRLQGWWALLLASAPWALAGVTSLLPGGGMRSLAPWLAGAAALLALGQWVAFGGGLRLAMALALAATGTNALLPGLPKGAGAALAGGLLAAGVLGAAWGMAFRDPLTGLPNRRALEEALAALSGRYAVAMADVDHFKRINDRHGHEAGDRVLQWVAQRLRRTRGGRAYRYGGEEFCLLFRGQGAERAEEALEAVRRRLARERIGLAKGRDGSAVELRVTVSIGLAHGAAGCSPAQVRALADQALYRAKAEGRNRLVVTRTSPRRGS